MYVRVSGIIDRVKNVESPPFRPTVPVYRELLFIPQFYQLMDQCWAEEPTARPDFKHINTTLRTFSARKSVAS